MHRGLDRALLDQIEDYVEPHLGLEQGAFWIVDDTGHRKYGSESVGVAHQYCGNLGKDDNCQVAVSLSLASARGSVPMDYRLYLPKLVGLRSPTPMQGACSGAHRFPDQTRISHWHRLKRRKNGVSRPAW